MTKNFGKTVARLNSDYLGISASVLCLIHCLTIPIALLVSQLLGVELNISPNLHDGLRFLDFVFLVVSLYAVYQSFKHSHNKSIKILFVFGWLTFFAGVITHSEFHTDIPLHFGTAILIIAHIKNIRECSQHGCESDH